MRTSHIAIQKRIADEKMLITDEELFASHAFAAYLTDLAEAASKRYKRPIRVHTYWDTGKHAEAAFTDNRRIKINAGNFLTQSFPTRMLRADSLVGMNAHEIGHILFTDFTLLNLYMESMKAGRMYPSEPKELSETEELSLSEIKEFYSAEDKAAIETVLTAAGTVSNILEDVYVEARMCDAFPGTFRTGILLNNLRLPELMPSVTKQIECGYYEFSIISNLIIQYCKSGDINNLHEYTGELLDALYDCIPVIDGSVYDDNVKVRYSAANHVIIKLWKYIKPLIEKTRKDMEESKSLEEALKELAGELGKQIVSAGKDPAGKGKAVAAADKFIPDRDALNEDKETVQKVLEDECARVELEKTDSADSGGSGGVTYDSSYAGSGYESAEEDMERLLSKIAEDRVHTAMEAELSEELQRESSRIDYGNAHRGVHIKVRRMTAVDTKLMESYNRVSPPLLLLSKRMQKQVTQVLRDKRDGGKQTGLLFGKRLNPRALVHGDGRYFYKNRLPDGTPRIAVGLLADESGSMMGCDRITSARAASIVIYDFCRALNIPVIVYGHTEKSCVEMYAYAEFDSVDNKDKYRLMDMSARSNNRDGAALRFVAEHLLTRDEEIKLLIVISDGQPVAADYYGTAAEADLRGIKREYQNKGITMFAAAIGEDKANIERIYGKGFLDISDLSKLPVNLTNLIVRHIKM